MNQARTPVVPTLILLNVVVFLLWTFAGDFGIETEFLYLNFLVSWESLLENRYWTLLGAAFSHNLFWHFVLNMFVLNSFGPIVEQILGPIRFLLFYLVAAIVSSFWHSIVSAFFLQRPDLPALGASGAISGVILLFSFLFPRQKILLMGFIPVPALLGALLFIGLDVWGLFAQAGGGGLPIGHGAHLGGALTGFIFYLIFFWRKKTQWSLT